ncbi:sensor histidine kinase [Dactylosporangium sp. CA-233914]|uniref:sensor histidine kinase n=1 Tax=Dactylosporangium sp. CA-233914 TaxID=3239934 RepID=UPI003D8B1AEB
MLLGVLGIRLNLVVQLLLAIREGLDRATRPWLFLLLLALMIVESVVVTTCAMRARKFTGLGLGGADVAIITVLIGAERWYSAPDDRVGTWVAWGFGAGAVAAVTAGAALPRWWHTIAGCLLIAGVYLTVSIPGGQTSTAVTNAVGLVSFAVVSRLVASYLRRLAALADQARAEAVLAARRSELDKHRLLLHDQATVLRLLSEPVTDPRLLALLRRQAAAASHEIRFFLSAERRDPPIEDGPVDLRDVITAAANEFRDLPITLNTQLVSGVEVPDGLATAIMRALRTVLLNVRVHAGAHAVTVHADAEADGWEITVVDDGVGFDPDRTPLGYGLSHQAGDHLRRWGVTTEIDSAPGDGTRITLRVPTKGTSDGPENAPRRRRR